MIAEESRRESARLSSEVVWAPVGGSRPIIARASAIRPSRTDSSAERNRVKKEIRLKRERTDQRSCSAARSQRPAPMCAIAMNI